MTKKGEEEMSGIQAIGVADSLSTQYATAINSLRETELTSKSEARIAIKPSGQDDILIETLIQLAKLQTLGTMLDMYL